MIIILFLSAKRKLPPPKPPPPPLPNSQSKSCYPTSCIHTETARYIYFFLPPPSFPSTKLKTSFPSFLLYSSTNLMYEILNILCSCQSNFMLQCPFHTHHVVLETNSIQFCISMPHQTAQWPVIQTAKLQINSKRTKSRHVQDTINKCYNYNDKTGKGKMFLWKH